MIVLINDAIQVQNSPQELYYALLAHAAGRMTRFRILSTTATTVEEYLTQIDAKTIHSNTAGDYIRGRCGPEAFRDMVWNGQRYGPAFSGWEKYANDVRTGGLHMRLHVRPSGSFYEPGISTKDDTTTVGIFADEDRSVPVVLFGSSSTSASASSSADRMNFAQIWRCVCAAQEHFKLPYEVSVGPVKQLVRVLKSAMKHFPHVNDKDTLFDETWVLKYFFMSAEQEQSVRSLLERMRAEHVPFPHVGVLDVIAEFQRGLLKIRTSRFLKDSTPISEFARYCLLVRHGVFAGVLGSRYDLPLFWREVCKDWDNANAEDRKKKMIGAVGVHRSWADDEEFKLFVESSDGSEEEDLFAERDDDASGSMGLELINESEEEPIVEETTITTKTEMESEMEVQPAAIPYLEPAIQSIQGMYSAGDGSVVINDDVTQPSSKDTTCFDSDLTAMDDETTNECDDQYEEKAAVVSGTKVLCAIPMKSDKNNAIIDIIEGRPNDNINGDGDGDGDDNNNDNNNDNDNTNDNDNEGDDENEGEEYTTPLPVVRNTDSDADANAGMDTDSLVRINLMDLRLQTELLKRPGALTALLDESSSASSSVIPSEYENESESVENSPKLLNRMESREETIPERIDRFEKLSGHAPKPHRYLHHYASSGDVRKEPGDSGNGNGNTGEILKKGLKHFVKRCDEGVVDELRALIETKPEIISLKSTKEANDHENDVKQPRDLLKTAKRGRSISEIFSALLDDNMKDLSSSAEYKNKIVRPQDLYNRMKVASDKTWEQMSRKTKEKYYGAFVRKYDDSINRPETCNIEMSDILEIVKVCIEFGDVHHRILQYAVNLVEAEEGKRDGEYEGEGEGVDGEGYEGGDYGDATSIKSIRSTQSLYSRKGGPNSVNGFGYGSAVMRRVNSDRT